MNDAGVSLPGGQEARGARPPRILHPGPLSEEMMNHSSLTTPASCSSSGSLLGGWTWSAMYGVNVSCCLL